MKTALLSLSLSLSLTLTPITVSAQEAPPTTSPENVGSTGKGLQIEVGWNYFRVDAAGCTLRNVFNELQADGGGALEAQVIWSLVNSQWKQHSVEDATNDTAKAKADTIFAFNSNQRAFFDIAPDACTREDEARTQQIEQIRDASQASSESNFISRLLSVPRDVWNSVLGGLGISSSPTPQLPPSDYKADSAAFRNLNVLGESTIGDLKITGNLTVGTLWMDGLAGSLNNLGPLKIQDKIGGPVEFLDGVASLDPSGNLRLEGGLQLDSQGARPACDNQRRGTFWFTKSNSGDLVEVCVRDSSGVLRWRPL